jgi:cytidylate kinase
MGHRIITIGRQFGSGDHEIGAEVARRLGIECYDKQLITMAAKRGALNHERLGKFDERQESPWLYEGTYEGNHRVQRGQPISEVLFRLQSDVIRSIARREDAVIIGRCADFVLREEQDTKLLTVFIAAPFENRVQRKMKLEGIGQKRTESLVRKMDKQRSKYYKAHTGSEWGTPENFNLYFNSGTQGFEGIIEDIMEAANQDEY